MNNENTENKLSSVIASSLYETLSAEGSGTGLTEVLELASKMNSSSA